MARLAAWTTALQRMEANSHLENEHDNALVAAETTATVLLGWVRFCGAADTQGGRLAANVED